MDKCISINKIVIKVTDDEVLRTFFTLYLAEDDERKRDAPCAHRYARKASRKGFLWRELIFVRP